MILGFKQYFPWGEPTFFREKIILSAGFVLYPNGSLMPIVAGDIVDFKIGETEYQAIQPKKHTVRDGHRWKKGMRIHMATGVRTKNYNCFNTLPDLQFVKSVQWIGILPHKRNVAIKEFDGKLWKFNFFREDEIETFALNDGFDSVDKFWRWFTKPVDGQLIHWTDLKY